MGDASPEVFLTVVARSRERIGIKRLPPALLTQQERERLHFEAVLELKHRKDYFYASSQGKKDMLDELNNQTLRRWGC